MPTAIEAAGTNGRYDEAAGTNYVARSSTRYNSGATFWQVHALRTYQIAKNKTLITHYTGDAGGGLRDR